ncbi:MAG TPA: hypothetical protein VF120_07415, partial [Ktedonobacterales bacterium]
REPDRFVSDREPDRKDRSLASTAAAPLYLDTEACAPEQLMGKPAVTATDVYALGVVLYAMLTGQSLYGGSMRDDVAQQHLYAPIPPLRALRAELPSELEPILARALAKDPRQRYQHPSELFAALRQVIQSAQVVEEEPPAALPPTVAAWGAVPSPQEKPVQPLLSNPAAPPAAVNQQSDVYAPQYGTPFAGNIAPPPALSPTRRSWAAPKPTLLGIMSGGGLLVLCVGMLLFSVGILGINPFAHATASSAHQPTATPVPSANPQPTATPQPLYSASLIDPADGWAGGDHCFFWSDGYHVKYLEGDPIHGGWHCESPVGSVADGYVSVQVKQLGGVTNYPYGILFREADGDNYYGFLIDSEGKWGAQKWVQGGETVLVKGTKNAIIHQGLYATNTLAVSFQGSHLEFYINGADVGGVDDTYFSLGNIALGAEQGQDVVFTNFQFAQL